MATFGESDPVVGAVTDAPMAGATFGANDPVIDVSGLTVPRETIQAPKVPGPRESAPLEAAGEPPAILPPDKKTPAKAMPTDRDYSGKVKWGVLPGTETPPEQALRLTPPESSKPTKAIEMSEGYKGPAPEGEKKRTAVAKGEQNRPNPAIEKLTPEFLDAIGSAIESDTIKAAGPIGRMGAAFTEGAIPGVRIAREEAKGFLEKAQEFVGFGAGFAAKTPGAAIASIGSRTIAKLVPELFARKATTMLGKIALASERGLVAGAGGGTTYGAAAAALGDTPIEEKGAEFAHTVAGFAQWGALLAPIHVLLPAAIYKHNNITPEQFKEQFPAVARKVASNQANDAELALVKDVYAYLNFYGRKPGPFVRGREGLSVEETAVRSWVRERPYLASLFNAKDVRTIGGGVIPPSNKAGILEEAPPQTAGESAFGGKMADARTFTDDFAPRKAEVIETELKAGRITQADAEWLGKATSSDEFNAARETLGMRKLAGRASEMGVADQRVSEIRGAESADKALEAYRTGLVEKFTADGIPENAAARAADAHLSGDDVRMGKILAASRPKTTEAPSKVQDEQTPAPAIAPPAAVKESPATVEKQTTAEPPALSVSQKVEEPVADLSTTVAEKAHEAATSPKNDLPEPTEAQKDAGNYKKGHVAIGGFDITIENPAGSRRRPEWGPLKDHYGYFKRSEGVDGDQVDVFINRDRPDSGRVFVIYQVKKDGSFDEHKAVMGAESPQDARAIYERNYQKGWKGFGAVKEYTPEEFRAWLKSDKPKKSIDVKRAGPSEPPSPVVAAGVSEDGQPAISPTAVAKKPLMRVMMQGREVGRVATFQEASVRWEVLRDKLMNEGKGNSDVTTPELVDESGTVIGKIGWNGRVFEPEVPGKKARLLYENQGENPRFPVEMVPEAQEAQPAIKPPGKGKKKETVEAPATTPPATEAREETPRQIKENAEQDAQAKKWGFTEKVRDDYGWARYRLTIESINAPAKKGRAAMNAVELGRGPNGKWAAGINISLSQSGSGVLPNINREMYDTRQEALEAGVAEFRKQLPQHIRSASDKKEAERLIEWLDTLVPPPKEPAKTENPAAADVASVKRTTKQGVGKLGENQGKPIYSYVVKFKNGNVVIVDAFNPKEAVAEARRSNAGKPEPAAKEPVKDLGGLPPPKFQLWDDTVLQGIIESPAIVNAARNTPDSLEIEARAAVKKAWGSFVNQQSGFLHRKEYSEVRDFIRRVGDDLDANVERWTGEVVAYARSDAGVETPAPSAPTIKVGDLVRFADKPDMEPTRVWRVQDGVAKLELNPRNLSYSLSSLVKADAPGGGKTGQGAGASDLSAMSDADFNAAMDTVIAEANAKPQPTKVKVAKVRAKKSLGDRVEKAAKPSGKKTIWDKMPPGTPSEQVNYLYRSHKRALTHAYVSNDPNTVVVAAKAALADFARSGLWPDQWADFERAEQDAQSRLDRGLPTWRDSSPADETAATLTKDEVLKDIPGKAQDAAAELYAMFGGAETKPKGRASLKQPAQSTVDRPLLLLLTRSGEVKTAPEMGRMHDAAFGLIQTARALARVRYFPEDGGIVVWTDAADARDPENFYKIEDALIRQGATIARHQTFQGRAIEAPEMEAAGRYSLKDGGALIYSPETYAKAKPLLQAMYDGYLADGKGAIDFLRAVVSKFGPSIRPFIDQFRNDLLVTETKKGIEPGADAELRAFIMRDGTKLAKTLEMKAMAKRDGITDKQMQERIEVELVRIYDGVAKMDASIDYRFERALKIYGLQPALNARTSNSMELQAYSTPGPLALLGSYMLDLTKPGTTLYEPTAGNAMLTIGADKSLVVANELDPERVKNLRKLEINDVFQKDATTFTPPGEKFDRIHTNPPFGKTDVVNHDGYALGKLEHVITAKALEVMKDDGAAVIILGANMKPGHIGQGAERIFFNWLYGHYHVVDNFEIAGELYEKQGAGFPVRVVVVSGRRAVPEVAELSPNRVDRMDTWDLVLSRAKEIRDGIERQRNSLAATRGTGTDVASDSQGRTPTAKPDRVPAAQGADANAPDRGSRSGGSRVPKRPTGGQSIGGPTVEPAPAAAQGSALPVSPVSVGPGGRAAGGVTVAGSGGVIREAGTAPGRGEPVAGSGPGDLPRPSDVLESEYNTVYRPHSAGRSLGTRLPINIAEAVHAALSKIEAEVGNLDEYVQKQLGYASIDEMWWGNAPHDLEKGLSGEQIDGIAMTIYQLDRGGAMIVGDETGIGKGRVGAGAIRYAKKQGMIPVFFTKDAKLFTDMARDLNDTLTEFDPLILGTAGSDSDIVDDNDAVLFKAPRTKAERDAKMNAVLEHENALEGLKAAGHDVIFSTYSQFRTENAQQAFLERLASGGVPVFVVMDEAHEAAGGESMQGAFFKGGEIKRGKGSKRVTINKRGILTMPAIRGALYLSATYAKRADNMPVFFRTDLGKAADNMDQLVTAMSRGGVPMQQAISEALAKSGQLIRRERDFSGVPYDMEIVKVSDPEGLVKNVDSVTRIYREIIAFSEHVRDAIEDHTGRRGGTAVSQLQIDYTEFAAVVHNNIGQLLFAAKVDATIDAAVAAHKRGEKPVIAVMNTMESFLDQYAQEHNIKDGDEITITFKNLVKHALDRSLRAREQTPKGDPVVVTFTPDELGVREAYDEIVDLIDNMAVTLPVSPIDAIRAGLESAGIRFGELTGRQSELHYTDIAEGRAVYRRKKKASKNKIVNAFNGGNLDGLLINASGATGLSIHASPAFPEKPTKPRCMIIAQAANDVNVFVQTLGRIKRTGMIPGGARYLHEILPLEAERRPAALQAKKMKSLNANTTARADSAIKINAVDMLNKYGDQVIAEYMANENPELAQKLGMTGDYEVNEHGDVKATLDLARRFTSRVSLIPNAEQSAIYEHLIEKYNEHIQYLKDSDQYDLESVVHEDWDGIQKSKELLRQGTNEDSIFTASIHLETWDVKDNRPIPKTKDMERAAKANLGTPDEFREKVDAFESRATEYLNRKRAEYVKGRDGHAATAKPNKDGSVPANPFDRMIAMVDEALVQLSDSTMPALYSLSRTTGDLVSITDNETKDISHGMVVKVVLPEEKGGKFRLRPGNIHIDVMVARPGGRLKVSLAKILSGALTLSRSSESAEELDARGKGFRYTRSFITGNPIRAYGATDGRGMITSFRSKTGELVTGLLMPMSWKSSDMSNDPRRELVNGKAVAHYLKNYVEAWGYGDTQSVVSGPVKIKRERGGYIIETPASRRSGGELFLDKPLRRLTGDFRKVGNKMIADAPEATIAKTADRIRQLTEEPFKPFISAEDTTPNVTKSNEAATGKKGRAALKDGGEVPVIGGEPAPWFVPLAENPALYFRTTRGDQMVRIEDLLPTHDDADKGVKNANAFMAEAAADTKAKRRSIRVSAPNADGKRMVYDGNSTFWNAYHSGWSEIPAREITEQEFLKAEAADAQRKFEKELEDAAPYAEAIPAPPPSVSAMALATGLLGNTRAIAVSAHVRSMMQRHAAARMTVRSMMTELVRGLVRDDVVVELSAPKFDLKGHERAFEKAAGDYLGEYNRLKDLLRFTLTGSNASDVIQIVDALEKRFGDSLVVKNNRWIPDPKNPKQDDYVDVNLTLNLPGEIRVEVQVLDATMAAAKRVGHRFYNVTRKPEFYSKVLSPWQINHAESMMNEIYRRAKASVTSSFLSNPSPKVSSTMLSKAAREIRDVLVGSMPSAYGPIWPPKALNALRSGVRKSGTSPSLEKNSVPSGNTISEPLSLMSSPTQELSDMGSASVKRKGGDQDGLNQEKEGRTNERDETSQDQSDRAGGASGRGRDVSKAGRENTAAFVEYFKTRIQPDHRAYWQNVTHAPDFEATEAFQSVRATLAQHGLKLVGVRGAAFFGYIQNNMVFLDVDPAQPYAFTVEHELSHRLYDKSPAFRQMTEMIDATSPTFREYRVALNRKHIMAGGSIPTVELAKEEFLADWRAEVVTTGESALSAGFGSREQEAIDFNDSLNVAEELAGQGRETGPPDGDASLKDPTPDEQALIDQVRAKEQDRTKAKIAKLREVQKQKRQERLQAARAKAGMPPLKNPPPTERGVERQFEKLGSVRGRISAIGQQARKLANILAVKRDLATIVKEQLPVDERGKFLSVIANAKTQRDFMKAMIRLDTHIEDWQRRSLVSEIKETVKDVTGSSNIAVEYIGHVKDLLDGYDLSKPTEATRERLERLKAYVDRERAAGNDVDVPARVLAQLRRLTSTPLAETDVVTLKDLLENIEQLKKLGITKLSARQAVRKAGIERDLQAILRQGTEKIQSREQVRRLPGQDLPTGDKIGNLMRSLADKANILTMRINPMDVIFDVLDGTRMYTGAVYRVFKRRFDDVFNEYLVEMDRISEELDAKAKQHNITWREAERIGVYAAAKQESGREKLANNGMTDAEIDAIIENMSPDEMAFYDWMRSTLDELRPRIAETMRVYYNQPLEAVENYFPFLTDWMRTEKEADRGEGFDGMLVNERMSRSYTPPRRHTEKGFSIKRVGAGKQAIRIDAVRIFKKHLDDALYLIHAAPTIRNMGELASRDEFKNAVGDYGSKIVLDWVDTLARKGGVAGDYQMQTLDAIRRNVGAATLGLKASTALIQITPIIHSMSLIGPVRSVQGMMDAASVDFRTFLSKNMAEIRHRGGDDPAYLEHGKDGWIESLQQAGFTPLKIIDLYAASTVAAGAYRKYLAEHGLEMDLNNPNPDAIAAAELAVRRTQSTGMFKDIPPLLARGRFKAASMNARSMIRAMTQFQNFVLNLYSYFRHEGARGRAPGVEGPNRAAIFGYGLAAMAATVAIRALVDAAINSAFGEDDSEYVARNPFIKRLFNEVVGAVPFVGSAYQSVRYGSVPVPVLDMGQEVVDGLLQVTQGKSTTTKLKGMVRLVDAGSRMAVGIPGTAQLSQLIRKSGALDTPAENRREMIREKVYGLSPSASPVAILAARGQAYREAQANGLLSDTTEDGRRIPPRQRKQAFNAAFDAYVTGEKSPLSPAAVARYQQYKKGMNP